MANLLLCSHLLAFTLVVVVISLLLISMIMEYVPTRTFASSQLALFIEGKLDFNELLCSAL